MPTMETMGEVSATPTMEVERREEPTEIGEERSTRLLQRVEADRRRRAVDTPHTAQVQGGVVFSFPSMFGLSTRLLVLLHTPRSRSPPQWSTFT